MFLQGSDGGQTVDGVSGKAGYALGHDQVDLSRQRVADHAVEAVALSGVAAGDAHTHRKNKLAEQYGQIHPDQREIQGRRAAAEDDYGGLSEQGA